MANLETLFIEIDGNASKASSGIDSLIGSLSSLGSEISKQLGSLKNLASALQTVSNSIAKGNIWKNLTPSTSSVTQMRKATAAVDTFAQASKRFSTRDAMGNSLALANPNMPIVSAETGKQIGTVKDALENTKQINKIMDTLEQNPNHKYLADYINQSMGINSGFKSAKESAAVFGGEVEKVSEKAKKATTSISKLAKTSHGLMSQIGRIAKTMLIRTAIRSLMKVAKEGLNNFYEYSKAIGSSYATAIDSLKTRAGTAGNQIGAALGTLLTTLTPIINAIVSVVSSAAEALTMLFSLFGGSTTYSKAVGGFNSVGSSASGADKKIKELLADFDELNVISQESGGGGGGGGGGSFGSMFKEMELPQWMIEWKPLLEALAFGTIGALVLPKIWEWIKKILDLFTGGGATNLLNILKHWKNNPTDGNDNTFSFPEQPNYKPFPMQPEYKPFPVAPDYGKAATDMGILSGAAIAAAPAVTTIVTMLEKLKTGLNLMDILKTFLTAVASKLGGSTIKVKVDRKEFDDFKKEFDDWNKDKSIILDMDINEFRQKANELDSWMREKLVKPISVGFDKTLNTFNFTAKGISNWVKDKETKVISVGFDETIEVFNFTARGISDWVSTKEIKAVSAKFDNTLVVFNFTAKGISAWASATETKVIAVNMTEAYATFLSYSALITRWANTLAVKYIDIVFKNYDLFLVYAAAITAFANATLTKNILISFANWTSVTTLMDIVSLFAKVSVNKSVYIIFSNMGEFITFINSLNTWASETLTKNVVIAVRQTGVSSIASDIVKTAYQGFSNVATTVKNFSNSIWTSSGSSGTKSNNTGLDWSLKNGLTYNGQNVVDLALKTLGFAEGGFPVSGDLFIANERSAEMIGSLNGRTAVVNNDQIIEGISRGVSEAQSEQNALLRQQNELLRGILEKEASVKIGASAMFGREVKRSLDLYNAVGG